MTALTSSNHRMKWVWLVWVLIATLFFTVLIVNMSIAFGRLRYDPTWDDVVYLNQGHRLVVAFREGGIRGLIYDYAQKPPRSFYAGMGAAFGFLLFGEKDWAPYAVNGIVLAIFLGFSVYLFRDRPWWLIAGVFVYILTSPIAVIAIHDFKPDLFSGLLMTIGSLVALGFGVSQNPWRRFACSGAFFGFAILAKSTTFPFTFFLAGCAFVVAVIQLSVFEKRKLSLGTLIGWGIVFVIPLLLISIVYFSVGLHYMLDYICYNSLGQNKNLWVFAGTLSQQFLYYLTGDGSVALWYNKWPVLALILVAVVLAFSKLARPERSRCIFATLLCILSYIFVSLNPMKNGFLGLPAQIFIIILPLAFLSVLLPREWNRLSRSMAYVVMVALVSPVIWFHPAAYLSFSYWYWDMDAPRCKAIDAALVDAIANDYPREAGSRRLLVCTTGFVNNDTLTWVLAQKGREVDSVGILASETASDAVRRANEFDYIITAQTGAEGQYTWFPSTRSGDEIDAAIAAKAGMKKLLAVASRTGKEFRVYRNSLRSGAHSFFGWKNPVGLVVFQKTNYLYGISNEFSVEFSVDREGEWIADLALTSKTAAPQTVQVLLDGNPVGTIKLSKQNVRLTSSFRFRVEAGLHRLSFQPSIFEEFPAKDGKLSSVVFDRLVLRSVSR